MKKSLFKILKKSYFGLSLKYTLLLHWCIAKITFFFEFLFPLWNLPPTSDKDKNVGKLKSQIPTSSGTSIWAPLAQKRFLCCFLRLEYFMFCFSYPFVVTLEKDNEIFYFLNQWLINLKMQNISYNMTLNTAFSHKPSNTHY